MRLSVCIPTYRRPEFLQRAVVSVLAQTCLAHEIILISRIDDHPTNEMVRDLIGKYPTAGIRSVHVSAAGFLPPIRKAIEEARGDIIVLLDDDAEAHPDWLEKIASHYNDPTVASVGGRCYNYFSGVLQHYPAISKVGTLSWYGRSVGNMYRDCTFSNAVDVAHLMGGNMSCRTSVFRQCAPDSRLGNNVAFHWEMDVGLQVRKLGYRVIFDPKIGVDHHSAPRDEQGMRVINYDAIYWSNHNYAFMMRKHLTAVRLSAYVIYTVMIGGTASPGFAYVAYSILRGRRLLWRNEVLASIRGRIAGLIT